MVDVKNCDSNVLQVRNGIDLTSKNKYLRTLVQNTYSFHLNEIFATVQNEYTDWAGDPGQINRFQLQHEAARALTDRLVVAPALRAADWARREGFPTYFYAFTHTKPKSDSSRRGSMSVQRSHHGDVLPLALGYPFAPELRKVPYLSFTSQQASLAQTIVTLWSNFAASGDPNRPHTNVGSLFERKTQVNT